MKSILIIDTPTTCTDCPCYDYIHGVCAITYKDCELRKQAKPTWCPLKPLPEIKYIRPNDTHDDLMLQIGWNDCIDEILGETE